MSTEWTDELRAAVIKTYLEAEPTPETSTEIVKEIADDIGKTTNGVRAILTSAGEGIYVKKVATKTSSSGTKATGTRVNKTEAIAKLDALITDNSLTLDTDITSKLTGKAANYFATTIEALTIKEA